LSLVGDVVNRGLPVLYYIIIKMYQDEEWINNVSLEERGGGYILHILRLNEYILEMLNNNDITYISDIRIKPHKRHEEI